jgi:putative Ca2+/H+ antiporter (TMEM165/GDT1 family)
VLIEGFLVSAGVVALAEVGDKTQLLTLVLAARFRRPWPIVLGIFAATLVNHALAGAFGAWITAHLSPRTLRWALGLSFLAMAAWVLIPDRQDEVGDREATSSLGVFASTVAAFFLAEMGDKTQIATVMLAARFNPYAVVAGTTLGMLLADAPVAWFGDRLMRRVPVRVVHGLSALVFAVLGGIALLG